MYGNSHTDNTGRDNSEKRRGLLEEKRRGCKRRVACIREEKRYIRDAHMLYKRREEVYKSREEVI